MSKKVSNCITIATLLLTIVNLVVLLHINNLNESRYKWTGHHINDVMEWLREDIEQASDKEKEMLLILEDRLIKIQKEISLIHILLL